MRRRDLTRIGRLAMAGSCAAVLASPGAAAAVARVERAYFFTGQQSGGMLPPPSNVPPKGLWVRSTAAGTQASSAIRFMLATGETAPTLKLSVHQMAGTPQIVVCPTTSTWKQGDAQPISAAPRSDCAKGQSVGGVSTDGKTVTFDLSNIDTSSGRVDLALIPAPPTSPAAAVPGTPSVSPQFEITFEPLSSGSVMTTPAVAPAAPAGSSAAQNSSGGQDSSGSTSTPSSGEVSPSPSAGSSAPAAAPSGDALAAPLAASSGPGIGPAPFTPPAAAVPTPSASPQQAVAPLRRARPIARKSKTSRVTRIVEGSALLYLLALLVPTGGLLGEFAQRLGGSTAGSGRPRLTLYDGPPPPLTAIETTQIQSGTAPALR
ncbi:MAG: hypothetical protein NVS3B21_26350 [Acidimicrobiales bacterium]